LSKVLNTIAIDFETANEDPRSACAVGLAWIESGQVIRREYRLIRPEDMRFNPINVRIHGICAQDVQRADNFLEVMTEFLPDFAGSLLLAHNASFDMRVLCSSLVEYGRQLPELQFLCTIHLARVSWPTLPEFKLESIARFLGFDFRCHHAGEDAFACAKIALGAAKTMGVDAILEAGQQANLLRSISEVRVSPRSTRNSAVPPVLEFVVRGSTGNLYEIDVSIDDKVTLTCGCRAGIFGRMCRHVTALIDGDVTNLISENILDVKRLAALIEFHGWERNNRKS
jgi:DNA polymerase-3 subunit epsilon